MMQQQNSALIAEKITIKKILSSSNNYIIIQEEIEGIFKEPLEWQKLEDKRERIKKTIDIGGFKDEEKCPKIYNDRHEKVFSYVAAIATLQTSNKTTKQQSFFHPIYVWSQGGSNP